MLNDVREKIANSKGHKTNNLCKWPTKQFMTCCWQSAKRGPHALRGPSGAKNESRKLRVSSNLEFSPFGPPERQGWRRVLCTICFCAAARRNASKLWPKTVGEPRNLRKSSFGDASKKQDFHFRSLGFIVIFDI